MPKSVARNEELPKIPITLTWYGLTTSTGTTTLLAAGQHPRLRLIRGAATTTVIGT